jgi:hypothetical protein
MGGIERERGDASLTQRYRLAVGMTRGARSARTFEYSDGRDA